MTRIEVAPSPPRGSGGLWCSSSTLDGHRGAGRSQGACLNQKKATLFKVPALHLRPYSSVVGAIRKASGARPYDGVAGTITVPGDK